VIADRARFRHAKKLERLAGFRLPELAFSGTMLETLSSRLDYDALDFAVREQILAFFNDFLRCTCKIRLCGLPEKNLQEGRTAGEWSGSSADCSIYA
jgi:superfamily II helicase